MARDHLDGHSRLVGWLKVALPLLALAILSSLFLVARTIDPEGAITMSEAELADRLREPRISSPAFAGVTRDGATVSITAAQAIPGAADGRGGGASAESVRAQMETPDGARSVITAGAMQMSPDGKSAQLDHGVLLAHSLGYEFRTDSMTVSLDQGGAESAGAVEGFGPLGTLSAGHMVLTRPEAAKSDHLLVFNDGVRLIYQPGAPAGAAD
ncbi:LptA/OstA family protein [Gemmobacter serpentinus]|uniref:hypothetical protein n=1 Tax=Gemmobacter serpentinus TaxID=2652247 RepID=UPI00124ED620|nr:hypothetical protein [Gemmobacter serpentinus]